ncbi:P-loop containing nucleoside triphosphate hydrolase protein [Chytriomyces sp. MP71]|nr:P-loop containing nucleoside triphosphate hydrolase protein [Chytriomyces sp. MP71]
MITKRVAFNLRTVIIHAVVRKSMRIDAKYAGRFSKGYVLNLINVDSEAVSVTAESVHQLWGIPAQIVMSVALLTVLIGSSIGAGIGALVASLLLLCGIVPVLFGTAVPQMLKLNDARVKMIREVLDGIRLVKIRSLGEEYKSQILQVRLNQLKWLKLMLVGVVCFVVVGQLANSIMPVASFTLYAVRGNAMRAAVVFPASALFNLLINPLITLPQVLNGLVTATVSWKRIYEFLTADDRQETSNELSSDLAISIRDASFHWPRKEIIVKSTGDFKVSPDTKKDDIALENGPRIVLKDVTLSVRKGTFVSVVGPVGSGKSSLLTAILGEMQKTSGTVAMQGSIAYCTQQPWIQTGTIEDNITFGRDLDETRLKEAIKCTSLESDLAIMPAGIKTVLGEKGTSISGGQKTRISLARAVYSQADVFLFDDPLSSLDAKVSRAVFNDCFKKALKGKTIMLATHNHDVLKETDHIVFLQESGQIIQGTHEELMKVPAFADFIVTVDDAKGAGLAVKKAAAPVGSSVSDDLSIIAIEGIESGSVKWNTYQRYIESSGGWGLIALLVLAVVFYQATGVLLSEWLSWWTDNSLLGESHDVYFWTLWYNLLAWAGVVFLVLMNILILTGIMNSTRAFHEKAVSGIINAPIWWFESQQIGRIMNRFTKDMAAIDQRLLPLLFQFIAGIGGLLAILVIIAINSPYLLIGVVPLGTLYIVVLRYYRATMRQLKRLESVQRSPLYSHVSEALEGVSTINAYKRLISFEALTVELLDFSNGPLFFKFGAELWVLLRLELLSASLIFILAALSTNNSFISASQVGIALVYTNSMTTLMNLMLQSAANMETEMVCVERLVEYADRLPVEGPARLPSDPEPGAWPKTGSIAFKGLNAFYKSKPDTPVLKDVELAIQAGEKVCVVGRTGSGKSTLLSVLLRFVDSTGLASIDGRDIKSLGLQTVRDAMEVIPQDIYLFSGTLRTTLDRAGKYTDEQLWAVLDTVGMKTFVSNQEQKLETPIENGGSNLSLGQRQLLYFARILLLRPKIILMDEATSSVDPETETTLRRVMKEQFVGTTLVAVLHRLQSSVLVDFDKVLVMDAGQVAEYDAPRALLARPDSIFASLYNATSGS